MKRDTLKTLALGAALGVIVMQFRQDHTNAGPQPPTPRVVPVVAQSVIAPTKAVDVGVTLHPTDINGVVQAPINLEPGEVFMLTALTTTPVSSIIENPTSPTTSTGFDGLRCIRRGSTTGAIAVGPKFLRSVNAGRSDNQHWVFPTGLRFERLPNGRAAIFLQGRTNRVGNESYVFSPTDLQDVLLYGYVTTDF